MCIDCTDIVTCASYIEFPWFHKAAEKVEIENAFLIIIHLIHHTHDCNHIALNKVNITTSKKAECEEFLYQIGLIDDSNSALRARIYDRFM